MIGSHDTFTYLSPKHKKYNVFKRWWKTQELDIEAQYMRGVRLFDIRVRQYKNLWQVCHGLVDLDKAFHRLDDICAFMEYKFPDALYRIVLERGPEERFLKEAEELCHLYPNLWRVDIKSSGNWLGAVVNNNQSLYDRDYKFALNNTWEEPAQELHGFVTRKNWWKINLKKEAGKINSSIFNSDKEWGEAVKDREHLYFLDYIETIKPKTQEV